MKKETRIKQLKGTPIASWVLGSAGFREEQQVLMLATCQNYLLSYIQYSITLHYSTLLHVALHYITCIPWYVHTYIMHIVINACIMHLYGHTYIHAYTYRQRDRQTDRHRHGHWRTDTCMYVYPGDESIPTSVIKTYFEHAATQHPDS